MIRQLIARLPPPARYLVALLVHSIAAATQQTPPAHFLAAAIIIPLTVVFAVRLLSFVAWLLPYLLISVSAFYATLGAVAWVRQRP